MQKVVPLKLLILLWLLPTVSLPQQKNTLWQPRDEVTATAVTTNKPIFIDVYTHWCRYCRIMDATTYRNDSVVNYLKQHYLRYKFNAEGKDIIRWKEKVYSYNPKYDAHDFAIYLTKGNLVFPTTAIITPGGQPFYKQGQIELAEMEMLLKYFAETTEPKMPLDQFAKSFQPIWKK